MKKPVGYHIVLPLLTLVALLPLRALYVLADAAYFLIYKVVRYRRGVVRENLAKCFPELTTAQRLDIERRFYRNFADVAVETIKLLHISDDEMRRRMEFVDVDLIDRLVASGRDVAVYFSHCGNWEWAPSVTLHAAHHHGVDYCQVYRPLRSRTFDALMLHIRGRFGSSSFPKATVLRDLIKLRRTDVRTVTGFMSDQKPSHGDDIHVVRFLNHPTAVITGTEQLGRRLKMAAVYWDVYKPSRGHYRIVTRVITDDIATTEPMSVTDTYANMLEETIRRNPAIWLWTHKRWKHPVTMPDEKTETDKDN